MSEALLKSALTSFKQGQFEQARSLCSEFLQIHPDQSSALMLMASIEHRLGNKAVSTDLLQRVVTSNTGNPAAQMQAITALQRINQFDRAAQLLDTLPNNHPGIASVRAQIDWQRGRYGQALNEFRALSESEPNAEDHHVRYVRALLRFGESQLAFEHIQSALSRFGSSEELNRLLAIALLDLGRASKAREHLGGFVESRQVSATLHHLLRALNVIDGRVALTEPGFPFANEHQSASWEGFHWLYQQASKSVYTGSGTSLLRWAAEQVPEHGVVVECGVYHGFSLALLASWLNRELHGFDSFQGLPEDWKPGEPAGSYSTDGKIPSLPEHVALHRGWFEETLPSFAENVTSIALLHIDCDLYSSTATVLEHLGPKLGPGAIVVFDDFLGYPGYRDHEFRAAEEFASNANCKLQPVAGVLLGRSVAFRVE